MPESETVVPSSKKMRMPQGLPTQATVEREHDAEIDQAETAVEDPKEAKVEAKKPPLPVSKVIENFHRKEDEAVIDWLKTLQNKGPIQVRVFRTSPKTHKGKITKGHLETLDDVITEDELRDQHGGGEYQLRVMRRNATGTWVFLTSTTLAIAGDPRIDNLPKDDPHADVNGAASAASARAGDDRMVGLLERELDRSRSSGNSTANLEQMRMMMAPLEAQIKVLTDSLRSKDDQLNALANKPQNPFQEKLLDKMIDQDSARVEAVRTQFMSEIRMLKEGAIADEKRLKDGWDRERDALKRDHDRELDRLKAGYERELASLKQMHDMVNVSTLSSNNAQKTQLESDNRRLERDITELRAENKELRAKKEQSPLEKAKEVQDFKEALGIGEDEDEKEKGTIEKVAELAMNSDKLFGFLGKWAGPAQQAAQPQQQQAQPQQQQMQHQPRVIRDKRTGQIFELGADGQYHPIRQRRQADGTETGEMEVGLEIPPEQVEMAKTILEQSFLAGKKPEVVASTISTALPQEIFQAIRDHGVDGFLKKVAKLGAGSPLRRQDGINWLRKLGKALIGDTTPEETEETVE